MNWRWCGSRAALLLAVLATPLSAQSIRGRVVLPDTITPISAATIVLRDTAGAVVGRVQSGADGRYTARLPSAGSYTVQAIRIGFGPVQLALENLSRGEERVLTLVMVERPLELAAVEVEGDDRCRMSRGDRKKFVHRHDTVVTEYLEFRRSATDALRRDLMSRDSVLQVGDSIPDLSTVDDHGGVASMRALVSEGVRYFYLYRNECPLCRELAPALEGLRSTARDSFACIAYQNGEDQAPGDGEPLSFGALGKGTGRRFPITRTVPSLIVVRADGRVVAIADGIGEVRRHLSLYTLIPEELLVSTAGTGPLRASPLR